MKEGGCRSIKYLHCGSSPGFKAGHGSFMAGTGGMRRAPSSDLNPASLKRGEKKEKFRKKQQREDRRRQEAARTEQQRAELLSSMLPLLLSGPETSWRQASLCLLSFGFSQLLPGKFSRVAPSCAARTPAGLADRVHTSVFKPDTTSTELLPWGFPVLSSSSSHPPEANPFFQRPWSRAFHVEQSTNILFGRIMSYKYDSFGRISPFSDPDTSPICLLLI